MIGLIKNRLLMNGLIKNRLMSDKEHVDFKNFYNFLKSLTQNYEQKARRG